MTKKEISKEENIEEKSEETTVNEETKTQEETQEPKSELEILQEENEQLKTEVDSLKDKNLRMTAEFDNYRRRTASEKVELMKNAGESIFSDLLPLIDNFERAIDSIEKSQDIEALKEGVELIHKEFSSFLSKSGVKEVEAKEAEFDTDLHEAITKIPAPTEELKGKVVDVVKKGYTLNEKVIRFAQVVIGE